MRNSQRSYMQRVWDAKWLYVALLIPLTLLIILEWIPAGSALFNSLFIWNGGKVHIYVGLENYENLLTDRTFRVAMQNLIFFVVFRVIMQTVFPFFAAEMIVNLRSKRWTNWWKIIFVFPMVVPLILNFLIWRFIYNPQVGLLNQTLELIGFGDLSRAWLADPNSAMWALSFVRFPWLPTLQFLIILGGLQSIPKEIHESSQIDGAGFWRRLFYIDIPMTRRQITLAMILTMIFMTQRFDLFLVMTNGGPGYSTMVPALQLFQSAFSFLEFGYASAMGVVLFVAMLGLTVLNLRVSAGAVD
jgi:raffinose/stachyose/melibiose transport system permease protein